MRRLSVGALIAATVLALGVSPGASTASPDAPRVDASADGLVPYDVIPNLIIDLEDGDKLALGAPSYRKVMLQRYDAATATWSAPELFYRRKNVECGGIDARSAGGAVAVIVTCQRYSWAEDQAPADSVALFSYDTVTWSTHRLEGEAYEEPGIAPGGQSAVWPTGQGQYVTWTPTEGFTEHALRAPDEEYTLTAVISDAGAVSYVYGAPLRTMRGCGLVILTRVGDAAPVRQEVRLDDVGCSDTGLSNVDSNTLVAGETDSVAAEWTIGRSGPAEPFAVTVVAPYAAPGLVTYSANRNKAMDAHYFTAPDLPLFSLGSPDRRRVGVQRYDAVAQRWAPAVEIYDHGFPGCTWDDGLPPASLAVVVAQMTCYPDKRRGGYPSHDRGGPLPRNAQRVLTTADGETWQSFRIGRRPLGVSADRAYVAVPSRDAVTVLSRERGAVRLPLPVKGRCSIVVPGGPDSAALLSARGRSRGWPMALSVSTPDGWALDRTVGFPEPPRGRCRRVDSFLWDEPLGYYVGGRQDGYFLRVTQRGRRWTVRATDDY